MKTHRFLASVAVASVLASASPVYAQVLGGGGLSGAVNGAMNGTLNSGLGGIDGMASGGGNGSVTGTLGGPTDAIGKAGQRAVSTTAAAADQTHDTVGRTRDKAQTTAGQGRDKAASAVSANRAMSAAQLLAPRAVRPVVPPTLLTRPTARRWRRFCGHERRCCRTPCRRCDAGSAHVRPPGRRAGRARWGARLGGYGRAATDAQGRQSFVQRE